MATSSDASLLLCPLPIRTFEASGGEKLKREPWLTTLCAVLHAGTVGSAGEELPSPCPVAALLFAHQGPAGQDPSVLRSGSDQRGHPVRAVGLRAPVVSHPSWGSEG